MATNTSKWDAITAQTLNHHLPKMTDQIFRSTPFLDWLRKKGRIKPFDGGVKIVVPLLIDGNDNFDVFDGYDTIDTKPIDGVTAAEYAWFQWASSISTCSREELANNGSAQIISLIGTKMTQLERSIREKLNTMFLRSDGTNTQAEILGWNKEPRTVAWSKGKAGWLGLPGLIDDESPLGGIDPKAKGCEFWRSLVWDYADQDGAPGDPNPGNGLGAVGYADISGMVACLSDGADRPDLILSDFNTWQAYRSQLSARQLLMEKSSVNVGPTSFTLDEVEWTYDWAVPEGTIYVLNSEYISLYAHKNSWFTPSDWVSPFNQKARYKMVCGAGQLITNARNRLGVLCNVEIAKDCFPVEVCNPDVTP